MMLTSESLSAKWNSLPTQAGGYTRVDHLHPLELYIGLEAINQKSLLLISSFEPSPPPSSKSLQVVVGQRTDGKWALAFRLLRMEQEEVYLQLCCDLIESARQQRNDAKGMQFVVDRYRRWHRLMETQENGLMGEAARKGLIGELLFLQRVLKSGLSALDAVNGWIGPESADRDFVFPDCWHEIKTAGAGAKSVSVSSLEQLDAAPPGELVVFFVDRTAPGDGLGFSLNEKVQEIKAELQGAPAALELFATKLLDYGYMFQREYDVPHYRFHGMRRYRIDSSFPRLIKDNVPAQIAAATYALSLAAIENWRTE